MLSEFQKEKEGSNVRKVNYFKEDCDLKPIMTGCYNDANMCFVGFNLNLHIFKKRTIAKFKIKILSKRRTYFVVLEWMED